LIFGPQDVDYGMSPFELTLSVEEGRSDLRLVMEYNTDLFEKETVERMLTHFQVLLEGILANPEQHVASLPLLSAGERHRVLVEWNNTEAGYPRHKCIHQLFEEQAARAPDAIAVSFGAEQLTYGDLNARANQLAHHLQKLGVGPDVPVGLCMQRSLEMIVGMFGILKAGGAYLPLDPSYPKERLAFTLQDARAPVLLTEQSLLSLVPEWNTGSPQEGTLSNSKVEGSKPGVICLDRDWERLAQQSVDNPANTAQPENLVYVIYTSGSAGTPKGVLTPHRALVNHSTYFQKRFGLGVHDRILQFAPLNFDVSAEELFPALITGASVVIRPEALSTSVDEFHRFVTRERLSILNLPTPYWDAWLREMSRSKLQLPDSLRLVVVGSETVSAEQYVLWRELASPAVRWCNAYGTTEDTITSIIFEPAPGEKLSRVPIGRPIANSKAFILDPCMQPVPVCVPGELYVGGDELARGYLNQPELTAKKFIPNPFSDQPGARLYQTGDLARYRPDGNIEFLGRKDYQVKIRGFRIELGEIETVLNGHPEVKETVVTAREDASGEKRLVAYYIPLQSQPIADVRLINFLKEKLPGYMVPSAFVPLKRFPLLPSGKTDRKALPEPGTDRPELEENFVPPSSSLEEALAKIWREVLGLKSVGIHDNFFDLGGHSLLAVRLFAQMEGLTGRKLSLMTLFHSPTIAQLAEILRRKETSASRSSLVGIQEHGSRPPLFLVHGAGGGMLWGYANLARHLDPDQPVYGFNSRGMEGFEEFSRVEEMAAQYVEELCAFQPEGPYHLGGYCFGGEVAFEMARQLTEQGRPVALLALLNAMPPNSRYENFSLTPRCCLRFLGNACLWFDSFGRWTSEQRRDFMRRKTRMLKKKLGRIFGRAPADVPGSEAEDLIDLSPYPEYQRKLWDAHVRASRNYRPKTYTGPITLFRTRAHPFICSFDPTFGWCDYALGGVTVKIVPGAHESILEEPHVWFLAEEMKKVLSAHASRPNGVLHNEPVN
jgi:amino acid adenylation domain-containing protein